MSMNITLANGVTNQTIVVEYGYNSKVNSSMTTGNRRYGTYELKSANADQGIVANTITVDDRDFPLFNNLLAAGTVNITNVSFPMAALFAAGASTIASGSHASAAISAPPEGYEVKLDPASVTAGLTVVKGTSTFTVNTANNVNAASTVNFEYAILTYNHTFAFAPDTY